MYIGILVLILVFFGFNLYTNYFHYKWFFLSMISGLCLSCFLYLDHGPFLPALFLYCLASSLYVGMFNINKHFAHPPRGLNPHLALQSTKASIALLSLFIVYVFLEKLNINKVFEIIQMLLFINCFWTLLPESIMKYIKLKNEGGKYTITRGFGANISTNATLLSLMAPFALINIQHNILWSSTLLILTLLAIIKTTAAAGFVAFVSSMIFFFICEYDLNPLVSLPLSAIIFLILTYIGDYLYVKKQKKIDIRCNPKRLWSLSGRKEIWEYSWNSVFKKEHRFFGIGVGAYSHLMPEIHRKDMQLIVNKKVQEFIDFNKGVNKIVTQEEANQYAQKVFRENHTMSGQRYIWAHNDALQFVIEGGYIGAALMFLTIASLIWMGLATQNYVALSFLLAYFVNSIANFPNHLANESFLVIIMLKFLATGA